MRNINLLGNTTRVETPFIVFKIGKHTFGAATKETKEHGTSKSNIRVTFPNFMQSLSVTKINGAVNTYNIVMKYQIRAGDDPNLLEKVFGSASKDRKATISYGDYSAPTFFYKDESVLITDVRSSIDVANSSITYTIKCISEAVKATGGRKPFNPRKAKPSDVIMELLSDTSSGLVEVFPGMRDLKKVASKGLIDGSDREVNLEYKNCSYIDYLTYLVSCMAPLEDGDVAIRSSRYILNVIDDASGEFGGAYFRVSKVANNFSKEATLDVYEIDIGYPTKDIVTGFNIDDNQTYSILYDYSKEINMPEYTQDLGLDGKPINVYSPSITNNGLNRTEEVDKTWWTQMTQFPITATLIIKGLLKPTLIASYVKINCYFFGRKHISSGYYIITKQEDTVNASGYRTQLSIKRLKSDDDL